MDIEAEIQRIEQKQLALQLHLLKLKKMKEDSNASELRKSSDDQKLLLSDISAFDSKVETVWDEEDLEALEEAKSIASALLTESQFGNDENLLEDFDEIRRTKSSMTVVQTDLPSPISPYVLNRSQSLNLKKALRNNLQNIQTHAEITDLAYKIVNSNDISQSPQSVDTEKTSINDPQGNNEDTFAPKVLSESQSAFFSILNDTMNKDISSSKPTRRALVQVASSENIFCSVESTEHEGSGASTPLDLLDLYTDDKSINGCMQIDNETEINASKKIAALLTRSYNLSVDKLLSELEVALEELNSPFEKKEPVIPVSPFEKKDALNFATNEYARHDNESIFDNYRENVEKNLNRLDIVDHKLPQDLDPDSYPNNVSSSIVFDTLSPYMKFQSPRPLAPTPEVSEKPRLPSFTASSVSADTLLRNLKLVDLDEDVHLFKAGFLGSWKKVRLILNNGRLYFVKSNKRTQKLLGNIPLDKDFVVSTVYGDDSPAVFRDRPVFHIMSSENLDKKGFAHKDNWYFLAGDHEKMIIWIDSIRKVDNSYSRVLFRKKSVKTIQKAIFKQQDILNRQKSLLTAVAKEVEEKNNISESAGGGKTSPILQGQIEGGLVSILKKMPPSKIETVPTSEVSGNTEEVMAASKINRSYSAAPILTPVQQEMSRTQTLPVSNPQIMSSRFNDLRSNSKPMIKIALTPPQVRGEFKEERKCSVELPSRRSSLPAIKVERKDNFKKGIFGMPKKV